MPQCENCETAVESTDDLEREEVSEIEFEGDETPQIRIGTGKRDVWRCENCGQILGVR